MPHSLTMVKTAVQDLEPLFTLRFMVNLLKKLQNWQKREKLETHLENVPSKGFRKEGAQLQTGGKRIGNVGYFVKPKVFSDVNDNIRITKEEVNAYDIVTPKIPFGGFKGSGMGKELGPDASNEYLENKTITIEVPSTN